MITFPKILQLGDIRIADALKEGEVEITEKIDGSMFGFGRSADGTPEYRSRGQIIPIENVPKMFQPAVDSSHPARLRPGQWIFGETLTSPHHNTLTYERVPKGNLIVFGFWDGQWANYDTVQRVADSFGYEVVPLLYRGKLPPLAVLEQFFNRISVLGKERIEGIVIKHTTAYWPGFGEPLPVYAKYVRQEFKEQNDKAWKADTSKSKLELLLESYRSEARWAKAVQHLRESGVLKVAMQDMPNLVAEVNRDIEEECQHEIKEALFKAVEKDLKRTAVRGLADWYKQWLATQAERTEQQ